jgi:hypothetical protein
MEDQQQTGHAFLCIWLDELCAAFIDARFAGMFWVRNSEKS